MAGNLNTLSCVYIETGVDANYDYVVTRGFEIVDYLGATKVTDGGTTCTLQTIVLPAGAVALGAALVTDTVDDIEYATTLVAAQATLAAGDTIRAVQAGSATAAQADIYVWVVPTTWIAG